MAKVSLKPGTMLNPVPPVMVSCGNGDETNVLTVAWTGIMNSEPPMCYVSVRKSRHSHHIIKESGEYVINLVNTKLVRACDFVGVRSGAQIDKWKEAKLTKCEADIVKAPMIEESPLNLECKVVNVLEYGSHDVFIGEIVAVHVNEELFDKNGRVCLEKADLVAYNHGMYMPLQNKVLGTFGFSVMKPKTAKKKAAERRNAGRMNQKKKASK
ncbi:MAG: flavin reductase family protein [Firmicutes bacterium]|nr:flavin reductase family protein [Bacillota bacterium]MBQ3123182.1 flavin reductase family protein [Bacillota bacterium]